MVGCVESRMVAKDIVLYLPVKKKTAVFQFVVGHHADNSVFTLILKKSC